MKCQGCDHEEPCRVCEPEKVNPMSITFPADVGEFYFDRGTLHLRGMTITSNARLSVVV
ncbi:hypothetical protein LCGC14_2866130 [marine sediment metagenome]|uniref:Uncharacterized protein n=1 Tax=marine sediment metagenome TaxID=412755 RepID=A0A0F8Y4H1_9ZZZZ